MEEIKQMWVDTHCPKKLDDYVLDPDIKEYFRQMVAKRTLQNFTMEGCPGSGKSTLAKIMANEFNAEVLFVKCATEGNIDVLRSKIEPFCNALSFEGRIKIVILDEVDAASGTTGNGSSFQLGLRTLIEAAQSDCRFILTCNYLNKVIPAVLSRCPVIPLRFGKKDLLAHVKGILDSEKIAYDKDSLKAFIEEAFGFYPDCRRIINYLQFCCNSGKLVVRLNSAASSAKEEFLSELVDKVMSSADMLSVRQFYMRAKDSVQDYVTFSSELFNYTVDRGMLDADGILELTNLIYQENVVIDKEVGFFAIVTALRKYGKAAK